MNEIKLTISEQLQQLQMFIYRSQFSQPGNMYNPHRGQGRVLAILKLKPTISQKELTYLLNMSKQAVGELIAKLEKSGYITREPSEDDKRVMIIKLTGEGAKAAGYADDATPETVNVLDCLDDEELAVFSEYLARIIDRYEEQFPEEDFDNRRQYIERFMSAHRHIHGHLQHEGHDFEHDFRKRFGHGHQSTGGNLPPFMKGEKNDK